jgi:hypothetical protein
MTASNTSKCALHSAGRTQYTGLRHVMAAASPGPLFMVAITVPENDATGPHVTAATA